MIEKGFIIRNGIKYGIGAEDANSVAFNNTGLDLASTNMQAVTEELNNAKLSKPEEITLEQYNEMVEKGTLDNTKSYMVITEDDEDSYIIDGSSVGYDNTTSGLSADNVQDAIDVIASELKTSSNTDIVPITVLSDSPFFSKGDSYCYYKIINGICYFQLFVEATADVSTYTVLCNSLPRPLTSVYFGFPAFYSVSDVYKTLQVNISTDGVMLVNNSINNSTYMLTGSYPIA